MVDINKALKNYGLGHITGSGNTEFAAAVSVRQRLIEDGHYSPDELPSVPDMILIGELYERTMDFMKRTSSQYKEQHFPIKCRGRNENGGEVLEKPVKATVKVYQVAGNEDAISSTVQCEYNTGGHGERCKASHPGVDKLGDGVGCPYSFDIPFSRESK